MWIPEILLKLLIKMDTESGNRMIAEGNKAIMLFDGWRKATRQTFDPDHNGGSNTIYGYEKNGSFVREEDVEFDIVYHKSWNALMPVVEKIESIHDEHHGYFGVHISSNSCSIQGTNLWKAIEPNSKYGSVYMSDPNAIFSTKIASTWYSVVQFIKWYNQQNLK